MQHNTPSTRTTRALILTTTASLMALSGSVGAFDARSIALGGATVANGIGVHGAIENPASLAAAHRRGDKAHFLLGGAFDGRDHSGILDIVTDDSNRDLADDLEDEIDTLSGSAVSDACTGAGFVSGPDDTVCLTGTSQLATLSSDALALVNDVDERPISGLGQGQFGFAVTSVAVPFALHVGARATGFGEASISDVDREYINDFVALLEDDELTLGDIRGSDQFDITATTVSVAQPEDVIESTGEGGIVIRQQFGLSLARSFSFGNRDVDIGVTTKFSSLTASGLIASFSDAFDEATDNFEDQFEDNENQESSFTFDVGVTTQLQSRPLSVSAVLRNIVPESIETLDGIEFDTTPQLLTGLSWQREQLSLMASVALNSAAVDGIDTQPVALGIEFGQGLFSVRGGLSADLGRDDDVVALAAGVKLGPVEIAGRLAGINQGQIGAQIAFGF